MGLLFSSTLFGQPWGQTENAYIQKIQVEDGLSQSNVNSIIRDSDGYMWFATDDGLNRFDGYEFKIFRNDPDDSLSISDNKVWVLYEDSKERLWIGTNQGGLCLYNKDKEQFTIFSHDPNNPNSLSQETVYGIAEDDNGNIWIANQLGLSILNYEENKFTNYYHLEDGNGIVSNNSNCIVRDNIGHMWLGTKNGISIIDTRTHAIQNISYDPNTPGGLLSPNVPNIFVDSRGNIWVTQDGHGTSIYHPENNSFTNYNYDPSDPTSINSNLVRYMAEDKNGTLFFGTDGGGISVFDEEKQEFTLIKSQNDPAFQNTAVYDLYIDIEGKMWIGTYGEGVKILDLDNIGFEHVNNFGAEMPETGKKSVLALAEDHQKNIWIGTDGSGLYKYNPRNNTYTPYLHDPKNPSTISSNVIKSILVDHTGNLYAGTYSGGLIHINTKTNRITNYLNLPGDTTSLPINHVWYVFEDSEQRIWVGTLGMGLSEFIPSKGIFINNFKQPGEPGTISNKFISKILEDKEGNLWLGTEGGGVNKYDKQTGEYTWYLNIDQPTQTINNNEVKDIYLDKDGEIWALTNGGGISQYDETKDKFIRQFVDTKLPGSLVAMLEDNEGNFWITSFSGLYKINVTSQAVRSYSISDGLQGNEFNITSKLIDHTGKYYFGGLNGFNSFYPEIIKENGKAPPLILTDFYLFHKPVKIGDETKILSKSISFTKEINLQPSQNVISIKYAALNYEMPNTKTYAYILEGFDNDWNYVDDQRLAIYTNLPHGNYTFKVKTTNAQGEWDDRGVKLGIKVIAPWHQLEWVRALFLIGIALLIFSVIRIRTHLLLKQKKRLEGIVHRRTAEIEHQKSEIEAKNAELFEQNRQIKNSHEKITNQNDELLEKNAEIIAQREQLNAKSQQLEAAHNELKTANKELIKLNNNLEQLVQERTNELQQTIEKLVRTDEGLNTFLYRSSHDLRGPITTLLGLVHLAKYENKDPASEKYYDKIQETCNQMLLFLKKLKETNTIFQTQNELQPISWNLLFNQVEHELSKIVTKNNLKRALQLNVTSKIKSDHSVLKTIVYHLMENAIIFNDNESPIVELTIDQTKDHLQIKVTDNGNGIDPGIKAKIFDMFFRGSEKSQGNGLGLFLVKRAVDMLNGEISVFSSEPGTTFVVQLPLKNQTTNGTHHQKLDGGNKKLIDQDQVSNN